MDRPQTITQLEELLELDRLRRRDGALPEALSARRAQLEALTAPSVGQWPLPVGDLVAAVRGRVSTRSFFTRSRLLDARSASSVLTVVAGLGVSVAGGLGPLWGRSVLDHLIELSTGPLPYALAVWGGLYPAVWFWIERRIGATPRRVPAVEGPLLWSSAVGLAGILLWTGSTAPVTVVASIMFLLALAAGAVGVARPLAKTRVAARLARTAESAGLAALSDLDASAARPQLELAVGLDVDADRRPDLQSALRVAALLEAEALSVAGEGVRGRALLAALGISDEGPEAETAVESWARRSRAPLPELLEMAGLHGPAGLAYRETGRLREAQRAYRRAAEVCPPGRRRDQALRGFVEVEGELDDALLDPILEELSARGGSAVGAVGVLAALPTAKLESGPVYDQLKARVAQMPPDRAIGGLEAIVGRRAPADLPNVHALLAAAYRRHGHTGTARRIEADIGPHRRLQAPALEPLPSVAEALELDTSDLASALEDRYGIHHRLGAGAMGTVYLAEDLVLGRRVALKVLAPRMASELFVTKFREEARIVAGLDHRGIVRVYDAGRAGPFTYFVMELVEGADLATVVRGPEVPSIPTRVRWIAEVAEAMAYAHDRGVIHRDLKPANVLVAARDGVARITDFGIAQANGPQAQQNGIAPAGGPQAEQTGFGQAGIVVGTPLYMAPEQLSQRVPAGPATDVYALGVTLYFALCGSLPFGEDPLAKLSQAPPSVRWKVPEVSEVVDAVVADALASEPGMRLGSMREMADRLRGSPEIDRRPDRRSRRRA